MSQMHSLSDTSHSESSYVQLCKYSHVIARLVHNKFYIPVVQSLAWHIPLSSSSSDSIVVFSSFGSIGVELGSTTRECSDIDALKGPLLICKALLGALLWGMGTGPQCCCPKDPINMSALRIIHICKDQLQIAPYQR